MNNYKIVFISNYFNHHQKYLSEELFKLTNGSYCFIETEPIEEERLKMGWGENEAPDYVKQSYLSDEKLRECRDIIDNADCIITGSAPEFLLDNRKKSGKLIFRYSERLLKKGFEPLKYPLRYLRFHKNTPKNANIYLLCASAYTAADYAKFGLFKDKTFKWGYFPEAKRYEDIEEIINSKKKNSILWVGRFLDLKHPDAAIRASKKLKENGYKFELNIIGTGAMKQGLKNMISDYCLENEVHMLGTMKPEQVREHMEKSQVYLFTSDRNEGWGAVLNEAMNSGCAVVASHAIGSVPFLLKNGENGLIYKDGDEEDLYNKVKLLLDDSDLCNKYGKEAYLTLTDTWSAAIAAKRFVELSESLLNNETSSLFTVGPCSKANIIKDDWFK